MKTTLEMPDELFRRAKTTTAQRGQSLKQLVTVALEWELAGPAPGTKDSRINKITILGLIPTYRV